MSDESVVPSRSEPRVAEGHASAPSSRAAASSAEPITQPLPLIAPRRLGQAEVSLLPLALGGSVFGWTVDDRDAHAVLDRFAALGGSLVDTADSYVGGRSEVIIGRWLRRRRMRGQMLVSTKIGSNPDNPGLTRRSVIQAVEASLERLDVDRIDLLFFHFDDGATPLEESLAAVDELVRAGKVRWLGASNFSADRLLEARVLAADGLPRFTALQTQYNLMQRRAYEREFPVLAKAQGLGVLPHTGLAGGFLTGRYRSRSDVVDTTRSSRAGEFLNRRGMRVLAALDGVARAHNEPPATVALAWLLSKPSVVAPVVSASRPEQVDALMAASAVRLTRSQIVELDRVSA